MGKNSKVSEISKNSIGFRIKAKFRENARKELLDEITLTIFISCTDNAEIITNSTKTFVVRDP